MSKLRYSLRLFMEVLGFARENKAYWIVPLFLIMGLAAFVVIATQTVTPLLYTLF